MSEVLHTHWLTNEQDQLISDVAEVEQGRFRNFIPRRVADDAGPGAVLAMYDQVVRT